MWSSTPPKYTFIIPFLLILNLSAFLHFYALDLRPLHHDEGYNGIWALGLKTGNPVHLVAGGRHGPLPHFFNALAFYLFGDSDFSLRFFASLFGLGLLILLFSFKDLLGYAGMLGSVLLLSVSPLMTYYSRFAINEIFLVFFTLIVGLALYQWFLGGEKKLFLLAAAAWALMAATKETWIVNLLALPAALLVTYYLHRRELPPLKVSFSLSPKILGGGVLSALLLLSAFYSNFFTQWQNLKSLLHHLFFWIPQGLSGGEHNYPFFTYINNLSLWEVPTLILAGISTLWWLKFRDRLGTYLIFWAFFALLGYSIIDYKTPWLMINILLPLVLLGGHSLKYLAAWLPEKKRLLPLGAVLLLGCFSLGLWKTVELNYRRYDDASLWVVYVQDKSYVKKLYNRIYRLAQAQDDPRQVKIDLILGHYEKSPAYWYLRRFPGIMLYDDLPSIAQAEMVLFSEATKPRVISRLDPQNYETGTVQSYPGVILHIWVKKEVWELYLKKNPSPKG